MWPDNPFLQALLADPEDDTLRLALADWLDESDQPARAEFVRVQIELARGVGDHNRRKQLEVRQRDLLVAHEWEWVEPLRVALNCKPGRWGGWVFRRGFVEYFHVPGGVMNEFGARLAMLTPVRELFLNPCSSGDVVGLCKQSWLGRVTGLYIPSTQLNESAARAILACRFRGTLRTLVYRLAPEVSPGTRAEFEEAFAHLGQK